mmetsp:Transcript_12201/g.20096  ORF Transcript_12201/g.20096 Transcript_12201/m.20096 type:complete len:247 (-) Transcript_12201:124-864(-)
MLALLAWQVWAQSSPRSQGIWRKRSKTATRRRRTAPRSSTGSSAMAKTRARSWSVQPMKGSLLKLKGTARTIEAMLPVSPCPPLHLTAAFSNAALRQRRSIGLREGSGWPKSPWKPPKQSFARSGWKPLCEGKVQQRGPRSHTFCTHQPFRTAGRPRRRARSQSCLLARFRLLSPHALPVRQQLLWCQILRPCPWPPLCQILRPCPGLLQLLLLNLQLWRLTTAAQCRATRTRGASAAPSIFGLTS